MENDLQKVEVALKPTGEIVAGFVKEADEMVVSNDEQGSGATKLLGRIKTFLKMQESDRIKFVKPLNDVVSEINKRYKVITVPVKKADKLLRDKLGAYQTEKEMKRRVEEERLRKEQEEKERAERKAREEKLKKEMPSVDEEVIKETVEELAPEKKDISVNMTKNYEGGKSKASFRTEKKFRVIDINKIARSFLVLDERAVQFAIDNGVKIIDGIEIWEEQIPVIR